jgi:hypothetical protein
MKVILLFVGVVIVTLMRNYNAFVLPALYWEDGTMLFAFYTNDPSPLGLFRFYNGYISLLPNLAGYLATFAPPPITPYIMGAYAMLLTGLTYTLFYLRRFRCVEENDQVRLFACVFLTLMPLGNFIIMSSATYSLWHLLWILIMLVYAPLGPSALGVIAQFVLLGFAVWSHPCSVLVIPLYIYNLFTRTRIRDRLFNSGLLLLTLGYCFYGVQRTAVPGKTDWFQLLHRSFEIFLERVIFESLFGNILPFTMHQQGLSQVVYLGASGILVCLGFMIFMRRRAFSRRYWWLMLGVFSLMIMLTVAGVMRCGLEEKIEPWRHRYFYIQQLIFLILVIITMNKALRWRDWTKARRAGVVVLIVLHLMLLNWSHQGFFKSNEDEGRRLAEFLRTLNETKHQPASLMPEELVLKRPRQWSIRIRIKPAQPNH